MQGRKLYIRLKKTLPYEKYKPLKMRPNGHIGRCIIKFAYSNLLRLILEGDMGICGVAVSLVFLCGVAVNKIPTRGVAVISNRTGCGVFDFKPAMFGEKIFLADPLWCCGLLFDTFDRLTLVE